MEEIADKPSNGRESDISNEDGNDETKSRNGIKGENADEIPNRPTTIPKDIIKGEYKEEVINDDSIDTSMNLETSNMIMKNTDTNLQKENNTPEKITSQTEAIKDEENKTENLKSQELVKEDHENDVKLQKLQHEEDIKHDETNAVLEISKEELHKTMPMNGKIDVISTEKDEFESQNAKENDTKHEKEDNISEENSKNIAKSSEKDGSSEIIIEAKTEADVKKLDKINDLDLHDNNAKTENSETTTELSDKTDKAEEPGKEQKRKRKKKVGSSDDNKVDITLNNLDDMIVNNTIKQNIGKVEEQMAEKMTETENLLLRGVLPLDCLPQINRKVVRIFISSTFSGKNRFFWPRGIFFEFKMIWKLY